MKNKRNIVTWEPDSDVDAMLKKAKDSGLTTTEILNEAMRDYGQKVIVGLAKQKARRFNRLASLSFDPAQGQHLSLAA